MKLREIVCYDGYRRALASIFYGFYDKKIGSGMSVNEQVVEELQKTVIKNFKRRKVHARFKDNIWARDLAEIDTAWKTISFPDVIERWSFQKRPHWSMIFLVILRKMAFLFPENMILFLGRKIKDDLSGKKNTWKYDILFKCPEEMVFLKRLRWNMIFLVLSGKMVFFPKNMIFFLWKENKRSSFSKNT